MFHTTPRERPPIDAAMLDRLALHYVGRYATTRAKLAAYLRRKLANASWQGDGAPPVDAIVERCAALGYVDDAAFATARGAALGRRGYGVRRVANALHAAGVADADAAEARETAETEAIARALAFARRKRIGPYASEIADREQQRRALAAMMRAGHAIDLARRIISVPPGGELDTD